MSRTHNEPPAYKLLSPLLEGTVAPGSQRGRDLIRRALEKDLEETIRIMRPLDLTALHEGMRSASIPERRISDLVPDPTLRAGRIENPFAAASSRTDPSPLPDPGEQMSRGPTPLR